MAKKVRDLRSALELLAELPGQLLETDVEVEPMGPNYPGFTGMWEREVR